MWCLEQLKLFDGNLHKEVLGTAQLSGTDEELKQLI